MRLSNVIFLLVFISAVSLAQVDTLGVVETGYIQVPSAIQELYIEDLDGDSIKEIIIAANSNIHIYNGVSYEHIWTSPEIIGPRDLKFADLNNDGLLDLAVRQRYLYPRIFLFDPHNSQTLWTGPIMDSTFKCYAVGDRNGDGWGDVAIVTKEPFTRYNVEDNMDTVWIDIYDGPVYDSTNSIILTLLNYELNYGSIIDIFREVPTGIEITSLGDSLNITPMLLLFNEIEWALYGNIPAMYDYYGSMMAFNALDFGSEYNYVIGKYVLGNDFYLDNLNVYKYYARSIHISDTEVSLRLHEIVLSNDSVYYYDRFFYGSSPVSPYLSLTWLLNGELNQNNNNREVAFAYYIPLPECYPICLYEELSGNFIWSFVSYQRLTNNAFVLSYPGIYSESKIVFKYDAPNSKYYLLNGETGQIDGLIILISEIMGIDNANNDLDDEIYVKTSNNVLSIYSLELLTDANESTPDVADFQISNYPNPFNSTTTIEYGLPEAGRVRIAIYDLLGRKVETLVDEEMQAGHHKVVWDAPVYSSGLYFYRIEARDFVETKRMVYLK